MIDLYAVHQSSFTGEQQSTLNPSVRRNDDPDSTQVATDYDFGQEEGESLFGGRLDDQLATLYPENESQSAPATEFMSMSELGIDLPDDACQSYDVSAILETPPEPHKEVLSYLASLNKTGELSF